MQQWRPPDDVLIICLKHTPWTAAKEKTQQRGMDDNVSYSSRQIKQPKDNQQHHAEAGGLPRPRLEQKEPSPRDKRQQRHHQ
jgi:hypothetical protein